VRGENLSPAMESHLAKSRSLLPKLALIFHLAEGERMEGEIAMMQAERAAAVCSYLEQHARRVYDSTASLPNRLAASLAQRLRSGALSEQFSVRDIYLRGWTGLDSADRARLAIRVLVDAGWVRRNGATGGVGRPSERYAVNPAVMRN
jgi:hypothetical protein